MSIISAIEMFNKHFFIDHQAKRTQPSDINMFLSLHRGLLIMNFEREYRRVTDSKDLPVYVGCTVRFRGRIYTIRRIIRGKGRHGTAIFEFNEQVHTEEIPDEISIDRIDAKHL